MIKYIYILKEFPIQMFLVISSFIFFIITYILLTFATIEPYYLEGLIFSLPLLIYSWITYITITGKLKKFLANLLSVMLIFVLGFLMLLSFFYISIDAATTQTTDIGKYQRVLRITGYPNNALISHFPAKIPNNAKDILFSYNPAFIQGGENFCLKYQIDTSTINTYIYEFTNQAIWMGKANDYDASDYGIFTTSFITSGYNTLPKDFTIYVIVSRPYKSDYWNHGEISLVAISKHRNEVIFLAEDW